MTQFKSLPAEILQLIFANLRRKKELEGCLLVCKFWNRAAADVFWENMGRFSTATTRSTQQSDYIDWTNTKSVVVDSSSFGYSRIDTNALLYIAQNMRIKNNLEILVGSRDIEGKVSRTSKRDPDQFSTFNLFKDYCEERRLKSQKTNVYLEHDEKAVRFGSNVLESLKVLLIA